MGKEGRGWGEGDGGERCGVWRGMRRRAWRRSTAECSDMPAAYEGVWRRSACVGRSEVRGGKGWGLGVCC